MCTKSCACPRCHSQSTLVDYWTLFLTLEEWPSAIFAISVITIGSNVLHLAPRFFMLFLAIAVIPTLFTMTKKKSCTECGIDFDTPIAEPVRSNRANRYEQF